MAYKVMFSSKTNKTVQSNYYNSINLPGQFTLQALSAFTENMGEGYKGNFTNSLERYYKKVKQGHFTFIFNLTFYKNVSSNKLKYDIQYHNM